MTKKSRDRRVKDTEVESDAIVAQMTEEGKIVPPVKPSEDEIHGEYSIKSGNWNEKIK